MRKGKVHFCDFGVVKLILMLCLLLTACDQMGTGLITIENEAEQFAKMEQELKDLKTIKVKYIAPERYTKMKEIIYNNYFRNRDDKKHQEEETEHYKVNGVEHSSHRIIYRTEDMYQLMHCWDDGVYFFGEFFGENYIYKTTEEEAIQRETEKLFGLLGLEFNNRENGYVIDRKVVMEDNSVEVHVKKYIEGKETSLAFSPYPTEMPTEVEEVQLVFGDNQLIGIDFHRLTEVVEIKDYERELLVDSPEKAYNLMENYVSSTRGMIKLSVDTARIAYIVRKEEDGIYTLWPMADFYTEIDKARVLLQVDLTTKEVWDTFF